MLEKANLGRLAPRWKGDRGDLVRVGGKKSRDPNSWNDSRRDLFDIDIGNPSIGQPYYINPRVCVCLNGVPPV